MDRSDNILVTGAGGQLGQELQQVTTQSRHRYIFTTHQELDLADPEALEAFVQEHQISVIVNCAAYTAVDRAEDEPGRAEAINHHAVARLSELAERHGIYLIHISTDYVFSGRAHLPRTELDLTEPLGVYGQTKLRGEEAIRSTHARALILRTSWVYSTYGSNFLRTMLRLLSEREELRIVFDQIGTPTYARDLARFIGDYLERSGGERQTGLYHFSGEGVCSWYDFAEAIRVRSGSLCRLIPIRSEDYPTRAPRPAYSVLDKGLLKRDFGVTIPHWTASLDECFARLGEAE